MSTCRILTINGDQPRRRYVRPGFDARDLSLSNEAVCWDSDWEEVLNVYRASWSAQSALTFKKVSISYQGQSVNISVMELMFGETLGYTPIAMGLDASR